MFKKVVLVVLLTALLLGAGVLAAAAKEDFAPYFYNTPNATLGANIDNIKLEIGDWNKPMPVLNSKNNPKLTLSTDERSIVEIRLEKCSDNVFPHITQALELSLMDERENVYIWANTTGRNCNTAEINIAKLNLSNGTYLVHCYDHSDPGGMTGQWYAFIINNNDSQATVQGVWFDGVQFGTQIGAGVNAINDGIWRVFTPKSDSKILLSTDYSLREVRITKINEIGTLPSDNTAYYRFEVVVFSQEFTAGSTLTTLEINVGKLNLSNGTYVIDYTNQSGSLRFWYPFVINSNYTPSTINTANFPDVPPGHWANDSIMQLTSQGVVSGYPDGSFKPGALVSRSEFAKMMYLALGIDKTSDYSGVIVEQPFFVDVPGDRWDYMYVKYVGRYMTGFMAKDGQVYFKGSEPAVREDMAVALVKALGLETAADDDVSVFARLQEIFSDAATISPNLRAYVLTAYEQQLISGYPDGAFGAQKSITRAETAALLVKVQKSEAMQKVTFR